MKPPLVPGDNLVVDGIPPIPAELLEQVGRYTESRAASFQDWHPTRAEIRSGGLRTAGQLNGGL